MSMHQNEVVSLSVTCEPIGRTESSGSARDRHLQPQGFASHFAQHQENLLARRTERQLLFQRRSPYETGTDLPSGIKAPCGIVGAVEHQVAVLVVRQQLTEELRYARISYC